MSKRCSRIQIHRPKTYSNFCSFDSRASPNFLVEKLLGDGLLVADLYVGTAAAFGVHAERERALREQSRF